MSSLRPPRFLGRAATIVLLASVLTRVATAAEPPAAPDAAGATAQADERRKIAAERSAATAHYAARERECRARFVVTSCVDDAKRERRQALDALKVRQLQLDETRRRARTAERRTELADKARDDAKRGPGSRSAASAPRIGARGAAPHSDEGASAPSQGPGSHAPAVRDQRSKGLPKSLTKARPAASIEDRSAHEAKSRAAFEARQRQAAEHRRQVQDTALERMNKRAPAASLPAP